uniref:Uncharacterized protein n=1 Tax=Anguilla anguilla TaxID=7936 RepID=A0A0E9RGP1_ANGAN
MELWGHTAAPLNVAAAHQPRLRRPSLHVTFLGGGLTFNR